MSRIYGVVEKMDKCNVSHWIFFPFHFYFAPSMFFFSISIYYQISTLNYCLKYLLLAKIQ